MGDRPFQVANTRKQLIHCTLQATPAPSRLISGIARLFNQICMPLVVRDSSEADILTMTFRDNFDFYFACSTNQLSTSKHGEVAEWLKAPPSRYTGLNRVGGSNPFPSPPTFP